MYMTDKTDKTDIFKKYPILLHLIAIIWVAFVLILAIHYAN